ncbi:MAG: DUF1801 domain-containing protein [Polyangiaceae bacterium]|jgi:hypothetical protein
MQSGAKSVADYLASLPADRRAAISALRDVIRANLDADYEEGIQYGMIGYYVPHRVFPAGYHTDPKQPLPFAALASQKNHMALYLMGVYCGCAEGPGGETREAKWFREAWGRTGKKLDMGRACVRFTKLENVALDVIGEAIRRIPAKVYVERYRETLAGKTRKTGKVAKKTTKRASKKN